MFNLYGSLNAVTSNIVTDFAQSSLGRYLVGGDVDLETVDHEAVDRLEHKLFPHRHSRHHPAYKNNEIRRLAIEKDPYDNNTVCRGIVMQYLCLFYGSDNSQYRNYCINKEDPNPPLQADKKFAPKAPCRSFCVQVATVCANDPTFIHTCNRIRCPPSEGSCESDPVVNGQSLSANLGCDVPYYRTPYNAATPSSSASKSLPLLCASILLSALYLLNL
eukprot:gene17706-20171_t